LSGFSGIIGVSFHSTDKNGKKKNLRLS